MDNKKVLKLLGNLKRDIAALENELSKVSVLKYSATKRDINYKNRRYCIEYNGEVEDNNGKGLTKKGVFRYLILKEARNYTIADFKDIFNLKYFPKKGNFGTYNYVIAKNELKNIPKSIQEKYEDLKIKSKDNKEIMIYNEWADFENKEIKSDGNFPILEVLIRSLGYNISIYTKAIN